MEIHLESRGKVVICIRDCNLAFLFKTPCNWSRMSEYFSEVNTITKIT